MKEDLNYVIKIWGKIIKEAEEIVKLGGGNIRFQKGITGVLDDPDLILSREVINEAKKLTDAGYGSIPISFDKTMGG